MDTVNQMADLGELDEDEMLLRAIAMSLEEEEEGEEEGEEEERKVAEDELSFDTLQKPGKSLKKLKDRFLSDRSIQFFR